MYAYVPSVKEPTGAKWDVWKNTGRLCTFDGLTKSNCTVPTPERSSMIRMVTLMLTSPVVTSATEGEMDTSTNSGGVKSPPAGVGGIGVLVGGGVASSAVVGGGVASDAVPGSAIASATWVSSVATRLSNSAIRWSSLPSRPQAMDNKPPRMDRPIHGLTLSVSGITSAIPERPPLLPMYCTAS